MLFNSNLVSELAPLHQGRDARAAGRVRAEVPLRGDQDGEGRARGWDDGAGYAAAADSVVESFAARPHARPRAPLLLNPEKLLDKSHDI